MIARCFVPGCTREPALTPPHFTFAQAVCVSDSRRCAYVSAMAKLFAQNIDGRGRLVRGGMAVALFVGAAFVFGHNVAIAGALALSGAFVLFEALRGWCAFRACGIKTKL